MSAKSTTTFTSRGRLRGMVRDEAPGLGQNRSARGAGRQGQGRASEDEALHYRARLILGESLPRPVAEPGTGGDQGSFERKLPISDPK